MLLPLCGITHEQMLVLLSSQSKSFGSAAALAPEGLDPDANGATHQSCWERRLSVTVIQKTRTILVSRKVG